MDAGEVCPVHGGLDHRLLVCITMGCLSIHALAVHLVDARHECQVVGPSVNFPMPNRIQMPSAALPTRLVDSRTRKLCHWCHGDGDAIGPMYGARIQCPRCEGTGLFQLVEPDEIPLTVADLHYRCGHISQQSYSSRQKMEMDRANARFAICKDCYMKSIGASEWIEEEMFFDRVRGRRERFKIVDSKWGPKGCDNPTMFYRFVEVKP
jgi:hypothetical protein